MSDSACVRRCMRRQQVDGLRKERLLFEEVLRKEERSWEAQKADMVALIQATATAHEQRQKVLLAPLAAPLHSDPVVTGWSAAGYRSNCS